MKRPSVIDGLAGTATALAAFIVYLSTLSPSVLGEDGGELAAALHTLGIPHPTGYPLYTLIGYAFSHLPLGGRVIWKLNLLSALLCAGAVFFYYSLFLSLIRRVHSAPITSKADGKSLRKRTAMALQAAAQSLGGGNFDRAAAAGASLALAFSATFWTQALYTEVYALHLLLLALTTWLFLRSLDAAKPMGEKPEPGSWPLFAFVLGLSFANHMTTLLLAPAFLYLFFATEGFGRNAWTKIGRAAFPFCLALSLYLYLPLRAAAAPAMNWGNPSDLAALWEHVTAEQYRYLMFSSREAATRQLHFISSDLPHVFGYFPLLLVPLGWLLLFRRDRRILIFSLLLWFGSILFSLNYDVRDPTFFLIAHVVVAMWIACGALSLRRFAGTPLRWWASGILCCGLALPGLLRHYRALDHSLNYSLEEYTLNVLRSVDSGAVILSDGGRDFTPTANYLQWVEGIRPDVIVLQFALMTLPWYYEQLETVHPAATRKARPEIDAFLKELYKYAPGEIRDSAALDERRLALILSFAGSEKPLYGTLEINPRGAFGFQRVPAGLTFRFFRGPEPQPPPAMEFSFRPLPVRDPEAERLRNAYVTAYTNQGVYRSRLGDTATARWSLRKALELNPSFRPAAEWLSRIEPRRNAP